MKRVRHRTEPELYGGGVELARGRGSDRRVLVKWDDGTQQFHDRAEIMPEGKTVKLTGRQLRRIIKEEKPRLLKEQVMWHSTNSKNVPSIQKDGLQVGRTSEHTQAGSWADAYYGTRPIYLSVEKGKYEGVPLAVNTSGLELVTDLPTLVDHGANVEEEILWWNEGEEPPDLEPYLENGEIQLFDLLNDPEVIQAAIDTTGTAAALKNIPPENISKKAPATNSKPQGHPSMTDAEKQEHIARKMAEMQAWVGNNRERREQGKEDLTLDQWRAGQGNTIHELRKYIRDLLIEQSVIARESYVLERSGVGWGEKFFVELDGRNNVHWGPLASAQKFQDTLSAEEMQKEIDYLEGMYTRVQPSSFFN